MSEKGKTVAYFSMEMGLSPEMATYSGGLGILAGDTIRSGADMKIPMVAMTLIHRKGYFRQKIDESGWQQESPKEWDLSHFVKDTGARVQVLIENRTVHLRAWKFDVEGVAGFKVPVYLLDSDLPENSEADRELTHCLYGGDGRYRLCQEIILGIGGVKMLRALGYRDIRRFHMNEGHAALLVIELLEEEAKESGSETLSRESIEKVKQRCVFTTHTPIPAGHDKFPVDLVNHVFGQPRPEIRDLFFHGNELNLTHLALNLSYYVNGVAKKHGEVSRQMFPNYVVDSITNGVHVGTWMSAPFCSLLDQYIPGWRGDNSSLRYALSIPKREIWETHLKAKQLMIKAVKDRAGVELNPDILTIGFARRMTAYKRADLIFQNVERLKEIAEKRGGMQILFAGKAHPHDHPGKEIIKKIFNAQKTLNHNIKICYLEGYTMDLGKLLTSGVDVWLNTPEPPLEASGTSGMKAALNGVPSLSILDGWWIEGCIEGGTGWAIGELGEEIHGNRAEHDAAQLYDKLEAVVMPTFYQRRDKFINIMRNAIALNGSFFNTQRMMQEYVVKAYFA